MTTTTKQNAVTSDSPTWNSFIGNLIAQEGAGGELISDGDYYREYNALHQLTKIRKKTATGKIIEEYSYGPDGERIMTVNYLTNTTIYTPFREWMMIVNRTGTYNYTYVYDGNTLISKINPDGTKWFYHDDHLGSTSLITDESGNIVEETFYNPFGQVTSGGEREAYLLYTNQMKDAIGCYDYGARVYCPKWYHFTSADPITANVFDPQGLNRFAYVKNNPYVYVDPDGKNPFLKTLGAVVLGSVIRYSPLAADRTASLIVSGINAGIQKGFREGAELAQEYAPEAYAAYKEHTDEYLAQLNEQQQPGTTVPPEYRQPDPRLNPKEDQRQEIEDATSTKSTYQELGDQSTPNEQRIIVDGASDPKITEPSTPLEPTDKEEKTAKGLLNIESKPDDSWKVVTGKTKSGDKDSTKTTAKSGNGGNGNKYNKNEKNRGKRGGR